MDARRTGVKALGYIRVSRVGGREGDSFISPVEQRKAIEGMAKHEGFTVVDYLEELDASGGDSTRPKWNEAIERIEAGEVQALAVWNLSRFSRSTVDALNAIERIEAAGGSVFSAAGDAGDSTPTGKLTRTIFLGLAQLERERAREGFAVAQASAIERRVAITSCIPFGFLRNTTTRCLEVDEERAAVIRQLFEHRAGGWSWTRMVRWWAGVSGESNVRAGALAWRIKNRTYLGEVNYGANCSSTRLTQSGVEGQKPMGGSRVRRCWRGWRSFAAIPASGACK